MAYGLEIKRTAQRSLVRLARTAPRDLERIEAAIDQFALDPRPPGAAKIRARPPVWRLRVGSYRVIYAVFDAEQLVVIGKVERRTERTYSDIEELFR